MDARCWWCDFCLRSIYRNKVIDLRKPKHALKVAVEIEEKAKKSCIGYWYDKNKVWFPIEPHKDAISAVIAKEQRERGFDNCFIC